MKWHRAVPHQKYALTYNEAGSLVSDAGRKIAKIDYDNMNNPVRIQFTNGNVTKYVYSAAGEKLRVTYQTAVPNITVATGSTRELAPSETLYTDSIDYLLGGALTLRNGRIDKFQFDEGYCQAERDVYNPGHDNFTFCYYDKDHLGNVRQVTELDGTSKGSVIQRNNYYPFGAEFCDNTANYSVQLRKYNGKEFDNMHGLNTYDYGARQYNPVTARWDRVDPLAHEYYGVSPYAYCANNPVNANDPDGRYVILLYNVTENGKTKQEQFRFDGTQSKCPNDPFIKDFISVYNTLKAKNTGKPLIEGVLSKTIGVFVGKGEYNQFKNEQNTVWWDNEYAEYTDNGGIQSPAVSLVHEMDHAVDYNKNPAKHEKRVGMTDAQYGDAEERRVITGSETETAKALGQGTRTNHYAGYGGYKGFKSKGPLSVKPETMKQNMTNRNKTPKSFLERLFNW